VKTLAILSKTSVIPAKAGIQTGEKYRFLPSQEWQKEN